MRWGWVGRKGKSEQKNGKNGKNYLKKIGEYSI
jgi:hypothetical protein